MRILIVCRKLDQVAGGVERSAIGLLNQLAGRGHEMHLLSWDESPAEAYYPLSPTVTWHRLDMGDPMRPANLRLRLARLWRIRRLVHGEVGPEAVIAFQHGPFLTVALALLGTGRPIVAAERNAPTRFEHLRAGRRRGLIFQSFRLAQRITVQFESYRTHYPAYLRSRIRTIPNPVQAATTQADPVGSGERRVLLSVGRLAYQKNPQCLVRAFARVAGNYPEWVLRLVGEGEDRAQLEELAKELGILERLEIVGATREVEAEYQNAQLFALASRWEGFPNAVAEALAHGLPVVAFAGCAGMDELVTQEQNGVLAAGNGDPAALADALGRMMGDPAFRAHATKRAIAVTERYRPERVSAAWETMLHELVARA